MSTEPATTPALLEWPAEITRPTPRTVQVFRGETVRLRARLLLRGAAATLPDGAAARACWRSADSADSDPWYTVDATLDADESAVEWTFGPDCDAGADAYEFFLRVEAPDGGGVTYRAFGRIAVLPSPGAAVNTVPLPVETIDFAVVQALHAPWTEKDASLFADLAALEAADTLGATKNLVNAILGKLKTMMAALLIALFFAAGCVPALAQTPLNEIPGTNTIYTAAEVDAAIAAIPAPTNATPGVWATNAYDTLSATRAATFYDTAEWLDAILRGGIRDAYDLHALREIRDPAGGMTETVERPGAWRLVGSPDCATLSGAVLSATDYPGLATCEFVPDAAGEPAERLAIALSGAATNAAAVVYPAAELAGTWRRAQGDALAALFAAADLSAGYTVATNLWFGRSYICTNYVALAPYASAIRANPAFFSPAIARGLRSYSPRWIWSDRPADYGYAKAGGFLAVAPHYALTINHAPPEHYFKGRLYLCLDPAANAWTNAATSISRVAHFDGTDILLYRLGGGGVPDELCARFLPGSVLDALTASGGQRLPGFTLDQHGNVVPAEVSAVNAGPASDLRGVTFASAKSCLVTTSGVAAWRNATYAAALGDLSPHVAHSGDSGHPTFLYLHGHAVPACLYWSAAGGDNLLGDALLGRIDAAIRADSSGAESLRFLSASDLQD